VVGTPLQHERRFIVRELPGVPFALSIRRYIVPYLSKHRLVTLTPRQVQLWIDDLVAAGYSVSIVVSAKSILSSAIKEQIQLGVRDTNPTLGVSTPKRRRAKQQTWSLIEVRQVLATVYEDPKLHAFYLTALLTGMRPGELRALMWQDIDIEAATITCRRTMTRDASFRAVIGTETKTQRSRIIAITPILLDALERWRHEQKLRRLAHASWNATGIVFDRGNGDFMPLTSLEKHHQQTIELAGVERIRLHDLRHTSATLELEAGTNPKIVAERLGHSSVMTTLDRYSHVAPDLQRSAADAMAARLLIPQNDARERARNGSD
jgi:integrase